MTHKICLFVVVLIFLLPIKAAAVEYTAPEVPKDAATYMPEDTESFADGLWSIVKSTSNFFAYSNYLDPLNNID